MTVSSTARKQSFSGGQSELDFTFRTLYDHPEYIKVKAVLTSSGAETELTYSTHYTVSVNSDGVGGTVTVSPTYSTLYTYMVYRETSDIQESDYDDYSQFPADTLEEDLDRRTLISQELNEETDRIIKLPISSSLSDLDFPDGSANTYIGWDEAGTALENKTIVDLDTIVTDTDGTLAANSDAKVATQKATKTYVDGKAAYSPTFATVAQINAGTSGTLFISPSGLTNSHYGTRLVTFKVLAESTALTTGDGKMSWRVPAELNGYSIISAYACIYTASATASTISLERGRRSAANGALSYVDILSTNITIDANEYDSINTTNQPVVSNGTLVSSTYADVIRINVDTAGASAAGLDVGISIRK
jgi:hypothetical protein